MKKILFLLITTLLLLFSNLFAAGSSMTFSYGGDIAKESGISILTVSWTSDSATGSVSATTGTAITTAIVGKKLLYVITDPGDTAPSDNYDISITTADGLVLTGGALLDRDIANTEVTLPYNGARYDTVIVTSALTIAVTNAGNSKVGTIKLVLSR